MEKQTPAIYSITLATMTETCFRNEDGGTTTVYSVAAPGAMTPLTTRVLRVACDWMQRGIDEIKRKAPPPPQRPDLMERGQQ